MATPRKENPQKAGRKSKYDPAYCEQCVEAGRQGFSLTAFSGMIGTHRETLLNWGQEHPEFFDAIKEHKSARAIYWEKILSNQANGAPGAPSTVIFALKNVAPEEFKDRQEHTGPDGGAIQTVSIIRLASGSDNAPK